MGNLQPISNRTKLLNSTVSTHVLRNMFVDELDKGTSVDTIKDVEGRNLNIRNIMRRRREMLL